MRITIDIAGEPSESMPAEVTEALELVEQAFAKLKPAPTCQEKVWHFGSGRVMGYSVELEL